MLRCICWASNTLKSLPHDLRQRIGIFAARSLQTTGRNERKKSVKLFPNLFACFVAKPAVALTRGFGGWFAQTEIKCFGQKLQYILWQKVRGKEGGVISGVQGCHGRFKSGNALNRKHLTAAISNYVKWFTEAKRMSLP